MIHDGDGWMRGKESRSESVRRVGVYIYILLNSFFFCLFISSVLLGLFSPSCAGHKKQPGGLWFSITNHHPLRGPPAPPRLGTSTVNPRSSSPASSSPLFSTIFIFYHIIWSRHHRSHRTLDPAACRRIPQPRSIGENIEGSKKTPTGIASTI